MRLAHTPPSRPANGDRVNFVVGHISVVCQYRAGKNQKTGIKTKTLLILGKW